MKGLFFFWCRCFVFMLLFLRPLSAQFLPGDFYLIDSLDVKSISPPEKKLLDSVLTVFRQQQNDTVKVNTLSFLAENLSEGIWQKYNSQMKNYALSCLRNEKKYSEKELSVIKIKLGSALNNEGLDFFNNGKAVQAIASYAIAEKYMEEGGSKVGLATVYNNFGLAYKYQGNIPVALEYYGKGLHLFEELKNDNYIGGALANIARIYEEQGDVEEAKKYYEKSLEIKKKIKDIPGIANAQNNLGLLLMRDKKYTEALSLFNSSLGLLKSLGQKRPVATTLHNIGLLFLSMARYEEAITYLEQAQQIYREAGGDQRGDPSTLINLAKCFFDLAEFDKAEKNTVMALEISKERGFPDLILRASLLLEKIFEKKGKYREALDMSRLSAQMRDSIFNQQNRKAIYKQEARIEFEKREASLKAEQEKRNFFASEEKKRQQSRFIIICVGFVIAMLFSFFVYRNLRINKSKNRIIQQQKEMVENKNKEILDSINYAKRIQEAISPPVSFMKTYLPESFIFFRPKDVVAGDFYFCEYYGGHIFLAAADCTGHGVPGALVSVICSNALMRSVKEFGLSEPGAVLDKATLLVSETFHQSGEEVKDGMDISLIRIGYEKGGKGKPVDIAWAGANNPLWYFSENKMNELVPNKQPVGQHENRKPFTTHFFSLGAGNSFYLFTDGYADQFGGAKGKKFKYRQLKELMINSSGLSMKEQEESLARIFDDWKGDLEQVDDVLVIGAKLT